MMVMLADVVSQMWGGFWGFILGAACGVLGAEIVNRLLSRFK